MKLLITELDRRLQGSAYQGYAYAYPHKTAYRPFEARSLREVWSRERRDALFLYVHVPFCEFRCGFCNLFTQTQPKDGLMDRYLDTLERQAEQVREALGEASFARFAVGGGTPTQLSTEALARVFDLAVRLGCDPHAVPVSVEMSPDTVTPEKMALLRERGVDRASMGVQSFVEAEARAAGRPQRTEQVERAIAWIQDAGLPVLNLDLIYGLPGQTAQTWRTSLQRTVAHGPQEIFLYPLYVRPLTGLGKRDGVREAERDPRLRLYRAGRDFLLEQGYRQVSMRLFRRDESPEGPAYCCQEDGMLGLGCGARSYTQSLHYSGEYAVGMRGVKAILAEWVERSDGRLSLADYGFHLDAEDQRRRFVIQSLLWQSGLVHADYRARFGSDPLHDLPELAELEPRGLAEATDGALRLSAAGLERSDVLGPWLASSKVRALMETYELA